MSEDTEKECKDCGRLLPESAYYKASNGSKGLMSWCKGCHAKRTSHNPDIRAQHAADRSAVLAERAARAGAEGIDPERFSRMKHNLVGATFGRWEVIGFGEENQRWKCRCSCDRQTVREIRTHSLLSGNSRSCGCLTAETASIRRRKRPDTQAPEHGIWAHMHRRCEEADNVNYPDYGGRGIEVCERWSGPEGFQNFYADMGARPSPNHSLDRIDVDGNYEPENCRWATFREQSLNRRNTARYTHKGVTKTIREWAEEFGVTYHSVHRRLKYYKYDFDKVVDSIANPQNKVQMVTYNGMTKTIREWSEITGVPPVTLQTRINRLGWSVEEALTILPHSYMGTKAAIYRKLDQASNQLSHPVNQESEA